ncbi:MAG: hypothetical protein J1E39_02825 [Eubacterium sp.]|nr:hypothetical protein [Eubacterium sp.]
MAFSELTQIEKPTGLTFDEEYNILGGIKNDIPVAVFDNYNRHRFDIIFGALVSDKVMQEVYLLTASFPKKTVLGVEKADGCLRVFCKDYNLSQERLPLLIEFLDHATKLIARKKSSVTELDYEKIHSLSVYMVLTRRDKSTGNKKKHKTRKLQITAEGTKSTLKGVVGGLLGLIIGASIFTIFIMLGSLTGWIGGVVMAAAIISMYTVFSRRLKTPDIIICTVLELVGWLFSTGFSYLFKIFLEEEKAGSGLNIFGIIDNLGLLSTRYAQLTAEYSAMLTISFIFVFIGAVGSCVFYFRFHRSDMY